MSLRRAFLVPYLFYPIGDKMSLLSDVSALEIIAALSLSSALLVAVTTFRLSIDKQEGEDRKSISKADADKLGVLLIWIWLCAVAMAIGILWG